MAAISPTFSLASCESAARPCIIRGRSAVMPWIVQGGDLGEIRRLLPPSAPTRAQMSVPKRWSITVPERKIAPAGSPEALAEAKKKLGPFEATHTSRRVCRCERCAEERIRKLAMRFNKLRFAEKGAPRAKHVTRNLEQIPLNPSRTRRGRRSFHIRRV
jgi:hypothetical protein